MERSLATIVKINKIYPIHNADKIVLAEIKGWRCIVKKDEFQEGDFGIYFSIDSIVDENDENFQFLKGKNRIKTIKMRGVISQGLFGPLDWLDSRGHNSNDFKENDDVTEQMGVKKYIDCEEFAQYNKSNNKNFPINVPKTDEKRIQDDPGFLRYIQDREIIITRKEDGCSCTFVYDKNTFMCCGRNYVWEERSGSNEHYFKIAELFNIEEKLNNLGKNIALQGEIVGGKINGNKLKLTSYDYRIFNIYNIDTQQFLNWNEVLQICDDLKLNTVPLIFRGIYNKEDLTVEKMLNLASEQTYGKNLLAEGIVIKTNDNDQRISFKVISNNYLLKHNK